MSDILCTSCARPLLSTLAIYVGDIVPHGMDRWACEACSHDLIAEAHEGLEGDGPPCGCHDCSESRAGLERAKTRIYAAVVGGLRSDGLRLFGDLVGPYEA